MLLCQFLLLAGNRFLFYILFMYLGYRTIQLWCCVSLFGIFFVVAGKWFWREIGSFFVWRESFITTEKKMVVLLCQFLVLVGNRQFFCCGGKVLLRPEKKVLFDCLAGFAVVSVFGSGDYDRKKKVLVVCLAGCAVVSVFGSGGK